jgi:hypothetical protein
MSHPAQPREAAAALASGHLGVLPQRGHGPHRLTRFWEPTRSADGSLCRYRRDAVGSASQPNPVPRGFGASQVTVIARC